MSRTVCEYESIQRDLIQTNLHYNNIALQKNESFKGKFDEIGDCNSIYYIYSVFLKRKYQMSFFSTHLGYVCIHPAHS